MRDGERPHIRRTDLHDPRASGKFSCQWGYPCPLESASHPRASRQTCARSTRLYIDTKHTHTLTAHSTRTHGDAIRRDTPLISHCYARAAANPFLLPPFPPSLSARRHGGDGCGIPNLCCGRMRRGAAQERQSGLDPGAERADAAGRHAATAASVFRAVALIDNITDGRRSSWAQI